MKKFTLFESSIVGLLVGVIISTYLTYLKGTGAYVGKILSITSLGPLLTYIPYSAAYDLIIPFIFFILVYILYAIVIALILSIVPQLKKAIIIIIILIICSAGFDQITGTLKNPPQETITVDATASVVKSLIRSQEKYFGNEVRGDLNADGKIDVAFILTEEVEKSGQLAYTYYLSAALKTSTGYNGTNILYLGNSVDPKFISISHNTITIDYVNSTNQNASSTFKMSARFIDGKLKMVEK